MPKESNDRSPKPEDYANISRQSYFEKHLQRRDMWPLSWACLCCEDPQSIHLADIILLNAEESAPGSPEPDCGEVLSAALDAVRLFGATNGEDGLRVIPEDGRRWVLPKDFVAWAVSKGLDQWMPSEMHEVLKSSDAETHKRKSRPQKTKNPTVSFPHGLKWSDVEVWFVDDARLRIRYDDESRHLTYEALEMADGRNAKPNKCWETLKKIAEGEGFLTVEATRRKSEPHAQFGQSRSASHTLAGSGIRVRQERENLRKTIDKLNRILRRTFGIKEKPIRFENDPVDGEGWRASFRIHPED